MSMLKCFFEIGCNKSRFDGLQILQEKELCEKYMGKFPVISITLKDVGGLNYPDACTALRSVIGIETQRFRFLEPSGKLSADELEMYRALSKVKNGEFPMSDSLLMISIKVLSQLLSKHYDQKVILLIDDYDAPLNRAFQAGYYDEMAMLIRNLFGNAMKTNDYLQFAVLIGSCQFSEKNIFTVLNNLNIIPVPDHHFCSSFGFIEEEMKKLLGDYLAKHAYGVIPDWYDKHQFGNIAVYCPWDIIKYMQILL